MSYAELRARQDPPWGNLAFGAGAVAYMLLRTGVGQGDTRRLAIAQRWLAEARQASRHPSLFFGARRRGSGSIAPSASLAANGDGIRLLELLVSHARCDTIDFEQRLPLFLARCRRQRSGPAELLRGRAGYLAGLLLLYRYTRDARALAVAEVLAEGLLARATDRRGWTHDSRLGFAHGRAGTCYALLAWSRASGAPLAPWFFGALASLAREVEGSRRMGTAPRLENRAVDAAVRRSWCNGAAGQALLWVSAYESTGVAAYLRLARRAARLLSEPTSGVPGDLCCGLVGRGFALLAMERVEPASGWHDRALALAVKAAQRLRVSGGRWPNSLLKGYPGLVCLVHDLYRAPGTRLGFPLLDG